MQLVALFLEKLKRRAHMSEPWTAKCLAAVCVLNHFQIKVVLIDIYGFIQENNLASVHGVLKLLPALQTWRYIVERTLVKNHTAVLNVQDRIQLPPLWRSTWGYMQGRNLTNVFCVHNHLLVKTVSPNMLKDTQERNLTDVLNVLDHLEQVVHYTGTWEYTLERSLSDVQNVRGPL
jgi:hypothetical protein